jgi:hypothetical protein
MIIGLSIAAFTQLHVILSLVGIASGAIVLYGMCRAKSLNGWTALFLATTVATSVTGFLFHSAKLGAPHVVGVISLVALGAAIIALYVYRLKGAWRRVYVVCAVLALYLNVFVAIVQAFQKLPWLRSLAPTQSEPPFVLAQLLALIMFVVIGIAAVREFRPGAPNGTYGDRVTSNPNV